MQCRNLLRLTVLQLLNVGLWLGVVSQPTPLIAGDVAASAAAQDTVLSKINRKISKQPKYEATPRYALLVLGPKAENKVWMVEDGKQLYVDANANGDLTDDGPPLKACNYRNLGRIETAADRWDFDYLLDEIAPADGTLHTNLRLARWNYGGEQKEDQYGLSLKLDGKIPMYAGWFGTFWAESPDKAPLMHFGGALEPRLLRGTEFVIGAQPGRLSIGLMNLAGGNGATTRLSIDALPVEATPVVDIDWPVGAGQEPLHTTTRLTERCCYWEFYDSKFQVPKSAAVGMAKLRISLEGASWPLKLTTDQLQAPVREKEAD